MELQTSVHPTTICPFLRCEDAPRAIEWLERAFGFQTQLRVPGPDRTIAHAREYLARDPEGHLWSFGTYRPAEALG